MLQNSVVRTHRPRVRAGFARHFSRPPIARPMKFFSTCTLGRVRQYVREVNGNITQFSGRHSTAHTATCRIRTRLLNGIRVRLILNQLRATSSRDQTRPLPWSSNQLSYSYYSFAHPNLIGNRLFIQDAQVIISRNRLELRNIPALPMFETFIKLFNLYVSKY